MSNILERTVGSGALFPINLDNGSWNITKGSTKLIEDSITHIMQYQIGDKLRGEIFGTRVYECLEEPNVNLIRLLAYRFIKDAIRSWEPRVKLEDVFITFYKEFVDIKIIYSINNTQIVTELDFTYKKP